MLSFFKYLWRYCIFLPGFIKHHSKVKTFRLGRGVTIGRYCHIGSRAILLEHVSIDDFSYINTFHAPVLIDSHVKIGKFCSIAPGVTIALMNHPLEFVTTHPILYNEYYLKKLSGKTKDIPIETLNYNIIETIIGNDVWIGANAIIKRGVTIGDGAVIAAGSVVTKHVEPYSIVGGTPAKLIRYRFSEEVREELKSVKPFWNYTDDELVINIKRLYDVNKYINENKSI